MTTRRMFAKLLPFLAPAPLLCKPEPELPDGPGILSSRDARDWAKAFVAYVHASPRIPFDEETMTSWFANALMRGYDQRENEFRKQVDKAGMRYIEMLPREAVVGAVARGWCAESNRSKEMDINLAVAITDEVMALGPNPAHHWKRWLEERNADLERRNAFLVDKSGELAVQNEELRDYRDRMERAVQDNRNVAKG